MDKKLQDTVNGFEETFEKDLVGYLLPKGLVGDVMETSPDLEECWPSLMQAYLKDAVTQFNDYPTVAFGWCMFLGMAVAKYWDVDWDVYGKVDNLYDYLLKQTDYDHFDDYVCQKVLMLSKSQYEATESLVGECAARIYHSILHLGLPAGSYEAYCAFVAALQALYRVGVAIELRRLGYKMEKY